MVFLRKGLTTNKHVRQFRQGCLNYVVHTIGDSNSSPVLQNSFPQSSADGLPYMMLGVPRKGVKNDRFN